MAKRIYEWNAVQAYYDAGNGFRKCSQLFGFSHVAWINAIKRGALRIKATPFADQRRKFDWAAVQRYYDAGHSYRETKAFFGFSTATWFKAIQRGEIISRSGVMTINDLLSSPKRNRSHVKTRLIGAGLLENRCEICGLSDWLGRKLSMHIDHTNGIKNDNRLENLRMLCPNCHSQTPTYSGRNMRRRRLQGEVPVM